MTGREDKSSLKLKQIRAEVQRIIQLYEGRSEVEAHVDEDALLKSLVEEIATGGLNFPDGRDACSAVYRLLTMKRRKWYE
jgi:hypothetical protein